MSDVEYAVDDRVGRVTLNRPRRGNGITRGLAAREGFKEAVRQRDERFGDWGR